MMQILGFLRQMGWGLRVFGCCVQAGESAVDNDCGLDSFELRESLARPTNRQLCRRKMIENN